MDVATFKELLDCRRLMDVQDRPLCLYRHPADASGSDSFFRCVSVALYGHPDRRVELRAACVLRFIRILFYKRGRQADSVQHFLDELSEGASVSRLAYRDEAVQAWVRRTHPPSTSCKTLFQTQGARLKAAALLFIRQNNQVGFLSCRFTFGYLLAALYPLQIHLYDQVPCAERPGRELVHIQPSICIEKVRRGEPPPPPPPPVALQAGGKEEGCEETHVYMWYEAHVFKLLVPVANSSGAQKSRGAHLRRLHMKQNPNKYELRKSVEEQRNVSVCRLRPHPKDPSIHYCTLSKSQLQEDTSAVYMLFPCNGRVQLEIPSGEHLFVYCVRESETDVRPRIECLLELNHDISYPYFLLPADTRHVLVTVSGMVRDDVLRKVAPYFIGSSK